MKNIFSRREFLEYLSLTSLVSLTPLRDLIKNHPDYEPKKADKPRLYLDCRFCKFYRFNQDFEVESFYCEKKHFDFIDWGNKIEGKIAGITITPLNDVHLLLESPDPTCKGKDFYFDPNTRWSYLATENH
ncbi:hypothetical protein A3K73_08935 [Candidatus Pacearchaeota archaeon RBG_13_36_9]|nr:MAG: hypothetical protein A3K73_08935 [Candidatus Pacearchaeota archaeon RBG_13_36_9]